MSELPNDVNDTSPTSIRHIVGQRGVVEQIAVALDAAHQDARKFDHSLLVGPPGCGKTATSQIIAQEMATDFVSVLGQSISSISELNGLLIQATHRAVIFIDEAHELSKSLQTTLYLALDQRSVVVSSSGKTSLPFAIPIHDFTLLLATTDEYQLLQPLRDRMRLVLRFQFYSVEELVQIVRHRQRALGWQVNDDAILQQIGARSRGTPRLALRLLQAAHRVSRSIGESEITLDHLERACKLEQIDLLGLGPTEQQYLSFLAERPTRLNVIASRLGLPMRTVSDVTESFLIRAGLVMKDDQGRRELTAAGRQHLQTTGGPSNVE